MMETKTTYTTGEKSIYFLTDKCLAQSLDGETPARNAIPSFDLVSSLSATASSEIAAAEASAKTHTDEKVAAEETRATEKEVILEAAISDEATRADTAEKGLASSIEAEAERAKTEEASIVNAVANETSRAKEAETALDGKTTALETAVEANKTEAASKLDEAVAALSGAVDAARYAVAASTRFEYDKNGHTLTLTVIDKDGGTTPLSVDATEFIANGIVDHIDIAGENVNVYWKNTSGSFDSVSIPISKLIQAYRAGDGIAISKNVSDGIYSISADSSIARVATLTAELADLKTKLTTGYVAKANAAEASAKAYADELDKTAAGRIASLEAYAEKLSTAEGTIATLTAADRAANTKILANTDDIKKAVDRISALESYTTSLSVDGGTIANLRLSAKTTFLDIATNVKAIDVNSEAIKTAQSTADDAKTAAENEKTRAEKAEHLIDDKILAIGDQTTALETKTEELKTSVGDAINSINTEKERADGVERELSGKITTNAANILANANAIEALALRVSTHEDGAKTAA